MVRVTFQWKNGISETATRYNYVGSSNATVAITETYAYGGRQGRVSSRTDTSDHPELVLECAGRSRQREHPQCAFAGCAPVSRTVSPGYTNGFLTSVPGHPNGMLRNLGRLLREYEAHVSWGTFKDYIYRAHSSRPQATPQKAAGISISITLAPRAW